MSAYTFDPKHHGSGEYSVVMPDGSVARAKPDFYGEDYIVFLNDGSLDGGYRDGFSNWEKAEEFLEDYAQVMLLEAALRMPKVA